ncbi:MAG TPA: hypothetical protein VEH48_01685, partial [Candidatus Nitrosopolaris sp.]|nr:hypothetical protein [Candidatus Nitrosopolaris sp.]
MARQVNKVCQSCQKVFKGRPNAKTCSDRCRKRLQRAKTAVENEAERVIVRVEKAADEIAGKVVPSFATEAGFVGDKAGAAVLPQAARVPQAAPWAIVPEVRGRQPSQSDAALANLSDPVLDSVPLPAPADVPHFKPFGGLTDLFSRRQLLAGLALVVLVGVALPFWLWPKSHPQNQPAPLLSSSTNLTGQTLSLNLNTIVANGKQLTLTGPLHLQPKTDSTSDLSVQNSGGTNVLVVDTVNSRVGIGAAPASGNAALQVNGNILTNGELVSTGGGFSLSDLGLSFNNKLVCSANGCVSSTSLPSFPAIDVANLSYLNKDQTISGVNVFSNSGNSFTGNGAGLTSLDAGNISSGTLNDSRLSSNVALLNGTGPQTFTGNDQFSGTFLAQNSADSTAAFQIQNTAGSSNLFVADTLNSRIGIGKVPALGLLDVNGNIFQNGHQVCDSSNNCG